MKLLLVLLCLGVFFAAAPGQEKFVMPVDEASQDASFAAFRTKLIAAAERRDANFIVGILDPKIQLSFGGQAGVPDFHKLWKIRQKDSPFWGEFLPVIKNGGAFNGDGKNRLTSFSAPYTFSSWPEDVDGFETMAIFGSSVNLRAEPSATADVVAQLSYNIVKPDFERSVKSPRQRAGDRDRYDWIKVDTLGGKSGFVKADLLRSHIDHRAGFEKKRGVWKMTYFISGD